MLMGEHFCPVAVRFIEDQLSHNCPLYSIGECELFTFRISLAKTGLD